MDIQIRFCNSNRNGIFTKMQLIERLKGQELHITKMK